MPRYPERAIPTNGWQAAGQAAQDLGQQLGDFSDRQARLRSSFQAMLDRRKEKALREMETADRARREEAELQLRRDKETREAAEAAKPKEWHPTTMNEAVQFEQKKAAAVAANKPPRGPSDGDKTRLHNQTSAGKMLPVIWEKIDRMWQKRPDEKAFLEEDGTPKTDPISGLPLRQVAVENWRKNMAALQKELNDAENTAGYPVTQSPFTQARSQSRSFLEYAQRAYPGKYPIQGGAPAGAPAAAPAARQSGTPAPGTVVDGYRFRGGDPRDPNAWEAAQ